MTAPIRVLLVDDHDVVRIGLRALLERADGIEVAGDASNGEQALAQCASLNPDVVVMDLAMGTMDGLTAIRQLARRATPPRVLALTMHEEEDYLIPALEAGATGYLVKSSASTDLVDAIRTVARGATWVRPSAAQVLARGWQRRSALGEARERFDSLSNRERDVFLLTAQGHPASRIGEMLFLSASTVETYRRRVNEKLQITDRSDYVRVALELGVLTPDP
jgi:DNA-binding NarL/FixJ family response regulator